MKKIDSYRFSHELVATVAARIMEMYGCAPRRQEQCTLFRGPDVGRGGFDFFAHLYDGEPQ